MKASGIKDDGRAAKTAPAAALDVLGAAGEKGVRKTEQPPLPDPGPSPLLQTLRGDPLLGGAVDDYILSTKSS